MADSVSSNKKAEENARKRKEITDFLVKLYDTIDKTKKNSQKFLDMTKNMSDSQFIAFYTSLINDPKRHLYVEIEAFENEPDYQTLEKAADVVGEKYHHLWDYINMKHLSDDGTPCYTKNKILSGYINLRRVQQMVNNKNHIPSGNEKRDPKTGQVAFESKAARISDLEQFAIISQGNKEILKEMYGPRGGDKVMKDEMEAQIASTGTARLDELTDNKINKTSLNTANMYFLAAGLETDLVLKNGILPRTLARYNKNVSGVDRTTTKTGGDQ